MGISFMRPARMVVPALLVAMAVVASGAAWGQGAGPGMQTPEQQRQLIEQKVRLVEMLAKSPAAKKAASGGDAEAANQMASVEQLLAQARKDLAGGKLDDAAEALDEALRKATEASQRAARGGASLSESAQKQQVSELTEQVATYRANLVEIARTPKLAAAAQEALAKIDKVADVGQKAAAAGRYGEASKHLAEAYRVAVETVSKLRAGETVVLALKFDTPADEYAYEVKRNHSHEILVDMMISEGKADGGKRQLIDRFLAENKRLVQQAEGEAKAGDHKAAISTMEQATKQLVRALQMTGMPVF